MKVNPHRGSLKVVSTLRQYHAPKTPKSRKRILYRDLKKLVGTKLANELIQSQNAPGQRSIPLVSQAQDPNAQSPIDTFVKLGAKLIAASKE